MEMVTCTSVVPNEKAEFGVGCFDPPFVTLNVFRLGEDKEKLGANSNSKTFMS